LCLAAIDVEIAARDRMLAADILIFFCIRVPDNDSQFAPESIYGV